MIALQENVTMWRGEGEGSGAASCGVTGTDEEMRRGEIGSVDGAM